MKVDNLDHQDHEKVQQFYDTVYYGDVEVSIQVSSHLRRLAEKLHITDGQKVLDIGCGAGAWLLAVQEKGAMPHGNDLSTKAIAICEKIMPNGQFHNGPAEILPFDDNTFDVVSCLGSLEHFIEPDKALSEMIRVAKDDAVFLLLVPNAGFLTRRLKLYSGTHQAAVREDVRSLEAWKALFESVGLRIEQRWKDLHVLSWSWVRAGAWYSWPLRVVQALALALWPLSWQYQVYHLCVINRQHQDG